VQCVSPGSNLDPLVPSCRGRLTEAYSGIASAGNARPLYISAGGQLIGMVDQSPQNLRSSQASGSRCGMGAGYTAAVDLLDANCEQMLADARELIMRTPKATRSLGSSRRKVRTSDGQKTGLITACDRILPGTT
jgi:hypothetical protein